MWRLRAVPRAWPAEERSQTPGECSLFKKGRSERRSLPSLTVKALTRHELKCHILRSIRRKLASEEVTLVFLAILIAAVLIVTLWFVPKWQVTLIPGWRVLDPELRFDKENEARKTLAQILGGSAILMTFYSTDQSLKTAMRQYDLTQEQIEVERMSKAVEELGNASLNVRIGGLYSLERIANKSKTDFWPIMEMFNAYVLDQEHCS
jgi:hypothetical protein